MFSDDRVDQPSRSSRQNLYLICAGTAAYICSVAALFAIRSPAWFALFFGVITVVAIIPVVLDIRRHRIFQRRITVLITTAGDDENTCDQYFTLLGSFRPAGEIGCLTPLVLYAPLCILFNRVLDAYDWSVALRLPSSILGAFICSAGIVAFTNSRGERTLRNAKRLVKERAPHVWARMVLRWETEAVMGEARGRTVIVAHSGLAVATEQAALKPMLIAASKHAVAVRAEESAAPHNVGDPVDCTVFAPPKVNLREKFLVQVFSHLPEDAERVAADALEFDDEARRRAAKSLQCYVPRNTTLAFALAAPGFEIDDAEQKLVWQGSPNVVQFGVTAPRHYAERNVIATVTVSRASIPIGCIKFKIAIGGSGKDGVAVAPEPVGDNVRHYRMAFVSYASEDRDRVLARVQVLSILGIKYFQDVLDLDPGDRWEHELYRRIQECDLFLIFWSSSAKQSEWVRREAKVALECQPQNDSGFPHIRPVIMERPPPKPWEELSHLHFNDKLIYFFDKVNDATIE